jgi:hypothetical protein
MNSHSNMTALVALALVPCLVFPLGGCQTGPAVLENPYVLVRATGTVTDPQGAGVPGVSVRIVVKTPIGDLANPPVTTNADGQYSTEQLSLASNDCLEPKVRFSKDSHTETVVLPECGSNVLNHTWNPGG